MARTLIAGEIINRVAVEIGLKRVNDPFSTQDEGFSQLVGLLNAAGQELAELANWNRLEKQFIQVTADGDDGLYDLPTDFDRIVQQTGWDRSNDVPVFGPLTPQQWAYLLGRDLESNSIYIMYRIYQGQLQVYPDPPPVGATIAFEYMSRDWVVDSEGTSKDFATQNSDTILLDPLLMQKFLKVKFLDAKSMPSQAARIEFENVLENRKGTDNGGQILTAGARLNGIPLLNGFTNTPDTGYGA